MRTIGVASGKGGVGKTCISINLAIALAKQGQRVLVFDADLQLANIDVMIGVHSEFNLQHVVNGERTLAEIIVPGPSGIALVTGGSGVTQLMHAGPKRMDAFFSQMDLLKGDFDYLFFDTAAGLDNRVFAFLTRSDETLVVATPEATSITDAYALTKVLYRRKPDAIVRILINRCSSEAEARKVFEILKTTLQNFLDVDVLYGGYVRNDPAFGEATRRRCALVDCFPGAKAASDFEQVARELAIPVYVASKIA